MEKYNFRNQIMQKITIICKIEPNENLNKLYKNQKNANLETTKLQ